MTFARTWAAWRSRPWPLAALAGFLVDAWVFTWVVQAAVEVPGRIATMGDSTVAVGGHLLAAALVALAFPGWYGRRGDTWEIPVSDESPAKALTDAPRRDFTVREIGATAGDGAGARAGQDLDSRRATHRLGPLMAGAALCFPVLGPLMATVVALVRRQGASSFEETIKDYRELVDMSLPTVDVPPDARPHLVSRSWEALELRPFVEIMRAHTGDDDIAVSAIESTSELAPPVAARLLRHALASSVPETRYYAARALTRIEEALERELADAQEAHKRRPQDPGPMMRIADARLGYGEIGQADDPLCRFHVAEAIRYYRMCLDLVEPSVRDECLARLASACLRAGETAESQRHYTRLVDGGAQAVSILRGCLEACFANRDMPALRKYIVIARDRAPDSDLLREVTRGWLPSTQRP